MTPPKFQTERKFYKIPLWLLEHLLAPGIITFLAVFGNNFYQAMKQPDLVVYAKEHQNMETLDGQYKVKCPFEIRNRGGSTTDNKKVTLSINLPNATIDKIDISDEYKGFYKEESGGCGYGYIIYSVGLPKNKKIEGTVFFTSNIKIPEKSICPLKITY